MSFVVWFFFFNDTATTEIYTLSLHDALPIYDELEHQGVFVRDGVEVVDHFHRALGRAVVEGRQAGEKVEVSGLVFVQEGADRKSTRLNSSHANISYAVFCLKKKKIKT